VRIFISDVNVNPALHSGWKNAGYAENVWPFDVAGTATGCFWWTRGIWC